MDTLLPWEMMYKCGVFTSCDMCMQVMRTADILDTQTGRHLNCDLLFALHRNDFYFVIICDNFRLLERNEISGLETQVNWRHSSNANFCEDATAF